MNEIQSTLPYSGILGCVYFISVVEECQISGWFKGMSKNVCYMTSDITSFAASSSCTN